jgi:predicted AAA+ superfamily ATPase
MYIRRHTEDTVRRLAKMFGAVLVTGARQVGKTTMLRTVSETARYVTLDDPIMLASAREHGGAFILDNPPPLFIDEIQYAPILFRQIKIVLDRERKKGQFFLSGSQQFPMMKNIGESLAGRLGLVTLMGLSLRETCGVDCVQPFLPTEEYFDARKTSVADISYDGVWERIHRGNMPEIVANADFDWQAFHGAYVKTYIERDVRDLTQVGDEVKFMRFMTVAAARTAQLLNLASLARDVGISQPTAERWLSILVTSNLVHLLPPYSNNITKRAVRTPKLYFLDTGLAAYLTRWPTPEVLKNGAMSGAFFETFVIAEIMKSYTNAGILDLPFYFYRDKDMKEIDLLIEEVGTLHPVEIKKHADPSPRDIDAFAILDRIPQMKRGPGGVISLYENLVTLKGSDRAIPLKFL